MFKFLKWASAFKFPILMYGHKETDDCPIIYQIKILKVIFNTVSNIQYSMQMFDGVSKYSVQYGSDSSNQS